jgi:hypothetical protein
MEESRLLELYGNKSNVDNRGIRPYPPLEECGLGSFNKFRKGVLFQL